MLKANGVFTSVTLTRGPRQEDATFAGVANRLTPTPLLLSLTLHQSQTAERSSPSDSQLEHSASTSRLLAGLYIGLCRPHEPCLPSSPSTPRPRTPRRQCQCRTSRYTKPCTLHGTKTSRPIDRECDPADQGHSMRIQYIVLQAVVQYRRNPGAWPSSARKYSDSIAVWVTPCREPEVCGRPTRVQYQQSRVFAGVDNANTEHFHDPKVYVAVPHRSCHAGDLSSRVLILPAASAIK